MSRYPLEWQRLQEVLQEHAGGMSVTEINKAIQYTGNLRTLQRWLRSLVDKGTIVQQGQGRGTRYRLAIAGQSLSPEMITALPLSEEGRAVTVYVTQPVSERQPVGYNRNFLVQYRPNRDSYLTIADKEKLSRLGYTAHNNQPAGTYAKEVLQRLLIDLSWNSSRLEGNTYTLLDTQRLIAAGEVADGKSEMDAQMILNHKDAIEFLVRDMTDIGFNRYTILNLHALLSNNLLPNPAASGRLRSFAVGIAQSAYTPLAVPQHIEESFMQILDTLQQIKNPFEQAFFAMVHLPYLQPFDDVNKRVSRLATNIPFSQHNLSPLSFVDVPQELYTQAMLGVYELNNVALLKDVFMWAYERSAARYAMLRQTLGSPDPFRMKYREHILKLVADVVRQAMSARDGNVYIVTYAEKLEPEVRARFIETVETELLSLHEGNFARYRVLPSEYKAWRQVWPPMPD